MPTGSDLRQNLTPSTVFGSLLLLIGALLLLAQLLGMDAFRLPMTASFWPLILIGVGLLLLFHHAAPRAD
jgi:hypothetical protein